MEFRNKQTVLVSISIAALIAAIAALLLLHNKRPTSAPAEEQLHAAIQAATSGNKNILVLFGSSW